MANVRSKSLAKDDTKLAPEKKAATDLPGQVVLVLQGGGALGAYQAGVYEALHEANIEPDWIVGTSIGAINGALIAGNAPENRVEHLRRFWEMAASSAWSAQHWDALNLGRLIPNLGIVSQGVPGFFSPKSNAWFSSHMPVGVSDAAYYSTAPLRDTLKELVDFERIANAEMRLTLGAVNVRSGGMRYFDSRDEIVGIDHVMASGALPPAFPAVVIDGEPYWDGGIYSNTPIEVVMNDNPRRDSLLFAAELWQQESLDPDSILEVMGRQKDIQYASQAESHTKRQQEIHHLRHIVRELGKLLPDDVRSRDETKELLSWGCGTVMHVVPLRVPAVKGEDHTKDIDFTPAGVRARWDAGREQTRRVIAQAPWNAEIDPAIGIFVHA